MKKPFVSYDYEMLKVNVTPDEATGQLQRQEQTQLESHQKILEDLTYIQRKSHDALSKLGTLYFSHKIA